MQATLEVRGELRLIVWANDRSGAEYYVEQWNGEGWEEIAGPVYTEADGREMFDFEEGVREGL